MFADIKFDELGEARARFEDERKTEGSTSGAHALATGVMPRGNGQRSDSGDQEGCGGRGGGDSAKRDSRGHPHYHPH